MDYPFIFKLTIDGVTVADVEGVAALEPCLADPDDWQIAAIALDGYERHSWPLQRHRVRLERWHLLYWPIRVWLEREEADAISAAWAEEHGHPDPNAEHRLRKHELL